MSHDSGNKPTGKAPFSIEELMHAPGKKSGELHISADTKRIGLFIILAVVSFAIVYFVSSSGDDSKAQLSFVEETPTPTSTSGPVTNTANVNGANPAGASNANRNANLNSASATVIKAAASPVVTANANRNATALAAGGTVNPVPTSVASAVPAVRTVTPLPTVPVNPVLNFTPLPVVPTLAPAQYPGPPLYPAAGNYNLYDNGMLQALPTPDEVVQKRETAASGPAAWWLALIPAIIAGGFKLARKSNQVIR